MGRERVLDCAFCGKRIYPKDVTSCPFDDDVYFYRDNFLQRKYFDDHDGLDNLFCSAACAGDALMLESIRIKDYLERKNYDGEPVYDSGDEDHYLDEDYLDEDDYGDGDDYPDDDD
jgi:hypothetical protein